MAEVRATGLVDLSEGGYNESTCIILKDEFKWFLSPEFRSLREGVSVTKKGGDVATPYINKINTNKIKVVIHEALHGGEIRYTTKKMVGLLHTHADIVNTQPRTRMNITGIQ